jgi:hypothetical protein
MRSEGVKDLNKLKKRARALRFCNPAPLLVFLAVLVAETTCHRSLKPRVYPQDKVAETTCPSTDFGSLLC